jgi:hypothetical protein
MNLTVYSKNKLMQTFADWEVPREYAESMYNYLVWGFRPGSCFDSILANDFAGAILRSHPGNTIEAFKALVAWIDRTVPEEAWGSYNAVYAWCRITPGQRRIILEKHNLIYTSKDEIVMILKAEPTDEPILY